MQIQIRLAEPFWRTIGKRNLSVEIKNEATVSDLLTELRQKFPTLGLEMDETPPLIITNNDEASDDLILEEDMLLHFIWPIAGG